MSGTLDGLQAIAGDAKGPGCRGIRALSIRYAEASSRLGSTQPGRTKWHV